MKLADLLLPPGCLGCGGWMGPEPGSRFLCPTCAARLRPPEPPLCRRCGLPRTASTPDSEEAASRSPGENPGIGGAPEPCPSCEDWPRALATARSAVVLRPPADELVHAVKYGGWPEGAHEMARALLPLLADPTFRTEVVGHAPVSAPVSPPVGGGAPEVPGATPVATSSFPPALVPIPTTPGRLRRRGYNQAERLAMALETHGVGEVVPALRRPHETGSQVALHRAERMANVHGAFVLDPGALPRLRNRPRILLVDDVLTTGATASAAAAALEEGGFPSVHLVTFGRALPDGGERAGFRLLPPGFLRTWFRTGQRPRIPR